MSVNDNELLNDTISGNDLSIYLDYDPNYFSPMFLYRPQNDVIASLIAHSSAEGAGRYELGRKIGLNTRSKGGNRRVSSNIQSVLKAFPTHFGQYQKMEGKYRTIKYYLKDPEANKHMFMIKKFEELTNKKCPFKFGEVLKFPNTKLNTLRISDITMKRMLYIIEILNKERFVLTQIKMVRYIQSRDAEEGYPFRIDKKSASKCLLALKRHGICRIFTTEVEEDGVKRPFEVITEPNITSVNDEIIQDAIKKACVEFSFQNKIFPTGSLRSNKKSEGIDDNNLQNNETNALIKNKKLKDKFTKLNDEGCDFLKMILRQKRDLPIASEKTISSLAATYQHYKEKNLRKRKYPTNSKNNTSTKSLDENDLAQTSSNYNSGLESNSTTEKKMKKIDSCEIVNVNTSTITDQEFSLMIDSEEMATIKDEIVSAISGNKINQSGTTNEKSKKSAKRQRNFTQNNFETTNYSTKKRNNRLLDEIDVISQNQKVYMRSRFSPRERDMLILIRSVSFFLNPIHRFWLDPTVMRDLMHKYVPESRCKTAVSLLASGNRDLSHPSRMAHLQYIVKTLSFFEEMRNFRNKIAQINMQNSEEKANIFIEAFETAYNLLFNELQYFPTIDATDKDFDAYIKDNNIKITPNHEQDEISGVSTFSPSDFPLRSLKPVKEEDVQHCVNAVMLNEMSTKTEQSKTSDDESFLQAHFIKQIGSKQFSESLDTLHRDGLISKTKLSERASNCELKDAESSFIFRNTIISSVFYRHFFNHMYHIEIMKLTNDAFTKYKQNSVDETEANNPGSILLLSECLTNEEVDVDFTVPPSFDDLFVSNSHEENAFNFATKQLRYLENADLNIDHIEIFPTNLNSIIKLENTEFETIISLLTHTVPIEEIENCNKNNLSNILNSVDKKDQQDVKLIYEVIEAANFIGVCEEKVMEKTKLEPLRVKFIINRLLKLYEIFPCGIDKRRYVLLKNAKNWMILNKNCGFFPRPWSQPSGEVNCTILSEAILIMIHKKPGILVREIVNSYAFVIQPIIIEEILCLLEVIGCCNVCAKSMSSMTKTFDGKRFIYQNIRYVVPVHNALIIFANFFKDYLTF